MKEFLDNQTDLAGSDSPMDPSKGEPDSAAKRCGSQAWDLPTVFGPIAVTYNISGVNSLNLDGPTTARSSTARSPGGTIRRSKHSIGTPICPYRGSRHLPQ